MQVDPNTQGSVYVATARGDLTLDPGREVVARVVAVDAGGSARINLAGQELDVQSDAPLRVGDEIRLSVSRADATGVRLAIVTPEGAGTSGGGAALPGSAANLVQELAKAGVPVTPQLAKVATDLAQQLGGGAASARAVAELAARDVALSPAAAGRVAAALEVAGSIGPALSSLAERSSAVALALPSGPPSAAALQGVLSPGLSSRELAVARIVQATQASAPGGPITLPSPPSSSVAVIQNYVSSQVATTASLDELAQQNTTLGTAQLLQARGQVAAGPQASQVSTPANPALGLTAAAVQSAIRGQAASTTPQVVPGLVPSTPQASVNALPLAGAPAAGAAAAQEQAQTAANSARANATGAAATGAAAAMPTPTGAATARAVADLANLAVRFAPAMAPGQGGIGAAADAMSRGQNAAQAAQLAGPAGSVGAATASVAGGGASDDPVPLVTSLQTFLRSPGSDSDAAKLLRTLEGSSHSALATAIRTLPEGEALRLAGRLLDLLPAGDQLAGPRLQDLRAGVHGALDQLGRSLAHHGDDQLGALRSVLEQVAANDPRPAVAQDAARLVAALDGQQILSRTSTAADAGYVYFQVPLPDGRGAEVLVRREPGRRQVSFDEFRIAFLLDTQQLGTLMIELDAHPAGIRADVRTDVPELEPWLRACTDQLVEPLAREARRPVTVTTGVFEQEPPASLLDPALGALEPGRNEFYA